MIGEFLAENVLENLEPEITEFFVVGTSITERTCGGLASALAQVPRGQAMLEDIERRGLFLQRIEHDRNWFRYHHMFGEFLRRRLEPDHPDRVGQLHRIASEWFAENDISTKPSTTRWARRRQPRGQPGRAGRDKPARAVENDDAARNRQKLPPRLVVSRARLQLTLAWANVLLQRFAPAAAALKIYRFDFDAVHRLLAWAAPYR
jgi:serine/threonine-protein kinase PknK